MPAHVAVAVAAAAATVPAPALPGLPEVSHSLLGSVPGFCMSCSLLSPILMPMVARHRHI